VKVLLINPPPEKYTERHDRPDFPHLGLGYLAAYLLSKRVVCEVIDARMEGISSDEVARRLAAVGPDLVGMTAFTHAINDASHIARMAKKVLPSCTTVLGGPHATALPVETLKENDAFDIVVSGEGEIALHEIVRQMEAGGGSGGIAGVSYRRDGTIVAGPSPTFLEDIDALPLPAWQLFPRSRKYPVMTARGCPYQCNFCMRLMGGRVRKRSARSVLLEIVRDVEELEGDFIDFFDETFAVDRRYAMELMDLIIERGLPERMRWSAETRVNMADLELFCKMKQAGCHFLAFGVESGSTEILKATGKGITREQAERAVSLARQTGLRHGAFFILGHPNETRETAQQTIDFAASLNTDRVAFGIMVPYPGTKVYELAKKGEGGYRMISAGWKDFNKQLGNSLEMEGLPRRELERLQSVAYLTFYVRNRRFREMLRLLFKERRTAIAMVMKRIKSKSVSRQRE
jgi:radical SAM superfamily enzyme YgiQ (UPF0313 family)